MLLSDNIKQLIATHKHSVMVLRTLLYSMTDYVNHCTKCSHHHWDLDTKKRIQWMVVWLHRSFPQCYHRDLRDGDGNPDNVKRWEGTDPCDCLRPLKYGFPTLQYYLSENGKIGLVQEDLRRPPS